MFQKELNSFKNLVMMNLIYVFHILVVGPLLVKVGMSCTCKNNRMLMDVLVFLGLGVMAYHSYKLYMYNPGKNVEVAVLLIVGLGLVLSVNKYLL